MCDEHSRYLNESASPAAPDSTCAEDKLLVE